ncbi:Ankyrin repeat-containing domain containing protein [Trema orientale]|uniref:Ankyrin repeat-containing domain containing protein n=1 Tax=Trema orientale TaxID=63057 RepID=A0A2P5FB04_TREOI|nr:Ankyrin repeat-containing domain containing protein [Trema orientale]
MVDKILKCYPVAIHDADQNMKNILLLAAENRQLEVYKLLMKNTDIPKDIVFRKVDNHRNSALHFAAMIKKDDHKPWPIPGAALQMQWEIKWYKFLDKSRSDRSYRLFLLIKNIFLQHIYQKKCVLNWQKHGKGLGPIVLIVINCYMSRIYNM